MVRVILVRSVLSSMLAFLLSNTWVSKTSLLKLEQFFWYFFWSSNQGGRGVHLLAWEVLCQPLRDGGLGIQSLTVRREALLAKYVVRFILYFHSMLSSLMRAKYGPWVELDEIQPLWNYSFMWREICGQAWEVMVHMH